MNSPLFSCLTCLALGLWAGLAAASAEELSPGASAGAAIQFIDSATGYALDPAEVSLRPAAGQWAVRASRYHASAGNPSPNAGASRKLRWHLDPLALPDELKPEAIARLHRPDATAFLGFVVDEVSGKPLAGVRVQSQPSGMETLSDERGYFQMPVPLPTEPETRTTLSFAKPGYVSEERQSLELWPNGDWVYRIRLSPGTGQRVIDENETRRHRVQVSPGNQPQPDSPSPVPATNSIAEPPAESGAISPASAATANLRVPLAIRVLIEDGSVDYVSLELYCRRSLPREWIASWAAYAGGSNSLQAGAVVVRTYAMGYVNSPRDATYDICSTTACQVYGTTTSTYTDAAVAQTTGVVMSDNGSRIARGLTEYSAENNSLGSACGDGYTAPTGTCLHDPVCSGETRYGHGRGLCQWGSARWATGLKFPNRSTADHSTANGYPAQSWTWILQHYYPNLQLTQGTPLAAGDPVKVAGTSSLTVRMEADGGIANGANSPALGGQSAGKTGVIIGGPVQVLSDGFGFTWWKIEWNDGLTGWSAENWLERTVLEHPLLEPIADQIIDEGQPLNFLIPTTLSDSSASLADFESSAASPANGSVLFRAPNFSGSTSGFLNATPNLALVTNAFPAGGANGSRVLQAQWSFTSAANAWLRLTTFDAASLGNPVIDLSRHFRFDMYASRSLRVGLGVRETTNAAGTLIGSNGGAKGAIEWVGVTNLLSGQPQPLRTVAPGSWTTLEFDLPAERIVNFSGGNGRLETASGLGVLEHLTLVPADGPGEYKIFLDNFEVNSPVFRQFSLGSGAPPGAAVGAETGVFSWTPSEAQGPSTNQITVRVSGGSPAVTDSRAFQVVVQEVNQPPVLEAIRDQTVYAGSMLRLTNHAADPDLPANTLALLLASAPPGAALDSGTALLTWQTSEADAGNSYPFTLRAVDNGVPPLSSEQTFQVRVEPRPVLTDVKLGEDGISFAWKAIPGKTFRVQYKSQLNEPAWHDLDPVIIATNSPAIFQDVPSSGQRFYRILWVETLD